MILRLSAAILRRDDETRTIEGYCYRNADAGDGWVVPRSLMERMAAGYLEFANVREMHQPIAVGTAEVTFDEQGAYMVCRVSDDQAWKKVQDGVYKAFSIGVKPLKINRSGDKRTLIEGEWYETSLVDRPADKDCKFFVSRGDGIDPVEIDDAALLAELEVPEDAPVTEDAPAPVVVEETAEASVTRSAFAEYIEDGLKDSARWQITYALGDWLDKIVADELIDDKAAKIRQLFTDAAECAVSALTSGEGSYAPALSGEDDGMDRVQRLATAETLITRLESELADKDAEIQRLLAQPDPKQAKPYNLTNPEDIRRLLSMEVSGHGVANVEGLKEELTRIMSEGPNMTHDEKIVAWKRIGAIKAQLSESGVLV